MSPRYFRGGNSTTELFAFSSLYYIADDAESEPKQLLRVCGANTTFLLAPSLVSGVLGDPEHPDTCCTAMMIRPQQAEFTLFRKIP